MVTTTVLPEFEENFSTPIDVEVPQGPPAEGITIDVFDAQAPFVICDAPNVCAITGIGGGKSEGGAIKLLKYLSDNPGALAMVTAPSFPMLRDATLRSIFTVFPRGWYTLHKQEMKLVFHPPGRDKNEVPAEVLFRTTDNPEFLRGPNLAVVWMDEAAVGSLADPDMQEKAFNILKGRLRQKGYTPKFWVTTTPKGFNWVWKVFVRDHGEGSPKGKDARYELFTWPSWKNPHLTREFVEGLRDLYSGSFADQEIEGMFTLTDESGFFTVRGLQMMAETATPPVVTKLGGLIRYWRPRQVGGRYVAFSDIAWGQRGAYSCTTIMDYQTGVQMAEMYGRPDIPEGAEEAVKLCRRYNRAFLGVEINGEGKRVAEKMVELGYADRMYHREVNSKKRVVGWNTDLLTRPMMLSEWSEALDTRAAVIYCPDAILEHRAFVRNEQHKPVPVQGTYGDHVMSGAGTWQMRKHATFGLSAGAEPILLENEW